MPFICLLRRLCDQLFADDTTTQSALKDLDGQAVMLKSGLEKVSKQDERWNVNLFEGKKLILNEVFEQRQSAL